MSRRRALLVGVLCLWGPVYVLGFFTIVVVTATSKGGLPVPFGVLAGLHGLTILILGVLLAICVRDAYRNPDIPDDRRTFWVVVLFLGNIISLPIYWWLYLRPGGAASSRAGVQTRQADSS
jgi:hypothetical protein